MRRWKLASSLHCARIIASRPDCARRACAPVRPAACALRIGAQPRTMSAKPSSALAARGGSCLSSADRLGRARHRQVRVLRQFGQLRQRGRADLALGRRAPRAGTRRRRRDWRCRRSHASASFTSPRRGTRCRRSGGRARAAAAAPFPARATGGCRGTGCRSRSTAPAALVRGTGSRSATFSASCALSRHSHTRMRSPSAWSLHSVFGMLVRVVARSARWPRAARGCCSGSSARA